MGTPSLASLSAMALPLAFVSLPLYVLLPNRYAAHFGVSLTALGALLLAVRALDAVLDPWLGLWCDRWFAIGTARVRQRSVWLCLGLMLSFAGLWLPDVWLSQFGLDITPVAILALAAPSLVVAYLAATALNLGLQSWGTRWGGTVLQRSRITAWREGVGLVGVVLASVLPSVFNASWLVIFFAILLAAALWLWRYAPTMAHTATGLTEESSWLSPLTQPAFRSLLQVFLLNGIASAVPATLVMFFIQDRLQAPAGYEAFYLGAYFVAAALSLPIWLHVVHRIGLAPAWLLGQALSVVFFMWTVTMNAGDFVSFGLICALSGVALGVDLVVPGALLTGVIARNGDAGLAEGRYLGWWQVATKLNLALAAGLALPALQYLGYSSGTRSPEGLWALSLAYGVLPCVLKLLAAWRLWAAREHLWEKSHGE
jgi:glycoside/pentoside/hexuronide:cation symporter, GPH family